MKKFLTLVIAIVIINALEHVKAQTNTFPSSGSVGIGTTSPGSSSLLEIKSTTKGMLIPRLTQTQKNAITSPVTGLLIYQTDNYPGFYYYDGSAWNIIGYLKKNGTSVFFNTGNVGIGTTSPKARLQVIDSSVIFSAAGDVPSSPHNVPVTGAGRRMMWYPDKAAFRVGYVNSNQWDKDSIGKYSFASGYENVASADGSVAMGINNVARDFGATVFGADNIVEGESSIASGQGNTIMPYGIWSAAIGENNIASGQVSIALGSYLIASGNYSIAMGTGVTTNGQNGSIIMGDDGNGGRSGALYYSDVPDQMQMVFGGGYRLYTGTSVAGVAMNHGDNSWSSVSDSTKKEKKLLVNGEDILNKISKLKLTTWNYKGQDSKVFRHYGPMAQDFHNAFGHDALGTIGNDTLINQQDFLGVSFIAIQALEKRTEIIKTQQQEIDSMQTQINELKAMIVSSANGQQSTVIPSASLAQNVPNPFTNSTTINYSLPQSYASAQLIITDKKGVALKQISLNTKGMGNINVDASTLAAGAYQYSLYVNGRLIDTKQMLLAK